jgi:uncharacterized protein YcbK (DUF882 family)
VHPLPPSGLQQRVALSYAGAKKICFKGVIFKKAFLITAFACAGLTIGTKGLQDAVANGDTRTISIYHTHSKETATVTFRRNGSYDREALSKLSWLLRDWRTDEKVSMDPQLFDVAWEVHRESGSSQPFHVVSAYRSPNTNAMLRSRSRAVAKHSQHMNGKAMDFYLPDVDMSRVRAIGMRLQRGGVGYYPSAFNPFVHLDAGSVRSWPRMPRDQLARLFPDGRTVHLPADGKPMARYEEARAQITAGGGAVASFGGSETDEGAIMSGKGGKSLWASLFGGDEEADARSSSGAPSATGRGRGKKDKPAPASASRNTQVAAYTPSSEDDAGTRGFYAPSAVSSSSTSSSARPTPPLAPLVETPRVAEPAPVLTPAKPSVVAPAAIALAAVSSGAKGNAAKQNLEAEEAQPKRDKILQLVAAVLPSPRPSDLKSRDALQVASLVNVTLPPLRPEDLRAEPIKEVVAAASELRGSQVGNVASITEPPQTVATQVAVLHPEPASRPLEAVAVFAATTVQTPAVVTPAPRLVEARLPPVRDLAELEALASQTASIVKAPSAPPAASQVVAVAPSPQRKASSLEPLFIASPLVKGMRTAKKQGKIVNAKARSVPLPVSTQNFAVAGGSDAATRFKPTSAFQKSDEVSSNRFTGTAIRPLASVGFEKL